MTNINRYRMTVGNGFIYRLPNGFQPSIIPDPRRPLRFEIHIPGKLGGEIAHRLGGDGGGLIVGLTTEQAETQLEQIAALLRAIENVDPSQHPELPESAYAVRNTLVWHALIAAQEAGIPAGVGWDGRDPNPVVVYIELPAGQCSWHLPAHPVPYDGHSREEKSQRIKTYVGG